jgi:4-hydroxy-2-oxoheptanedioate aldolase
MDARCLGQALRSGKRVYGTLVVSPSPRWPQSMRGMDLDFVFIDTEHIAIDRHPLSWMCQLYEAIGMVPIVRVPAPDPYMISMVIDGGARGVVAPYIETVDQVRMMREAVKVRPIRGCRGKQAAAGEPLGDDLQRYVDGFNQDNLLILNIESVPALESLDNLLDVPGIDAILIGPHDLTCSLGVPEQYDHPRFRQAVSTIFSKARQRGIGAGIHYSGDPRTQVEFARLGANMIIHSSDVVTFTRHMRAELDFIRGQVGDAAHPAASPAAARPSDKPI